MTCTNLWLQLNFIGFFLLSLYWMKFLLPHTGTALFYLRLACQEKEQRQQWRTQNSLSRCVLAASTQNRVTGSIIDDVFGCNRFWFSAIVLYFGSNMCGKENGFITFTHLSPSTAWKRELMSHHFESSLQVNIPWRLFGISRISWHFYWAKNPQSEWAMPTKSLNFLELWP